MKKFKNMIALLLAALLVISLAACGNSASTDTDNTTTAAEQSETANSSDNSENTESNVPGDFPGAPPEGDTGGTPPDKPDGNGGPGGAPGGAPGASSAEIDYTASVEITSGDSQSGQTYASTTADESALLISTSDEVTITNPTVTKTGDSDGGDNCNFYGLNAAVLVKDGSTTTITGGTITSDADGANGIFSYGGNGGQNGASGDGTTVIVRDTKIITTGDGSGGIMTTGDAPSCLVDQKNAVRFVKFNILLGNLPGSVDYFVSTGGSGGGAHATMLAATSNNPDFYDYEISQGAVGVYKNSDGSYSTTVTVNGREVELSDGLWGCMAYSAITSLAEADMTLAFEYYLNPDYSFNTDFQKQLAEYLAAEYMEYINAQNLSVDESKVGFDLNGDGDASDTVALTIEYDETGHEDTNGYYGTYLGLYLAEFEQSLQDYIDRLAYAEDWTWFNSDGTALSDSEVAAMTDADRAEAFINGWYVKGSTGSSTGGMEGGPDGSGGPGGDSAGGPPSGEKPDGAGPGSDNAGGPPDMNGGSSDEVGTPDSGTTQSASSKTDSANYSSFSEMLAAYQADITEIQAGDEYGNNIVDLYNPLNYIGADGTNGPTWARILMGASEGDISMMNSLNLQIAWLNAGTDAEIEWQWNGGHVPSEIFGDSLALYVDTMYGEYVDGAVKITKAAASGQTSNGDGTEPTGTDLSGWVSFDSTSGVGMTLAGAAAYRTSGAAKAMPGFDVMDYGQEDYVFGNSTADARHWDTYVLKVFEEHADTLAELFN